MVANPPDSRPGTGTILGLLVGLSVIGLLALFLPQAVGLASTWLLVMLVMLICFICIGLAMGKGAAGLLIDPTTNMMTLARLQVVLWTWLILSAFVTAALARAWDAHAHHNAGYCTPPVTTGSQVACADPLGIQLPPLLWALIGVSITTTVGSPLLKINKQQKAAEDERIRKQAVKSAPPGSSVQPVTYSNVLDRRKTASPDVFKNIQDTGGVLVKKASWRDAAFSDIFTGDEVSTFGYVDVARVQAFFFTLVAFIAYAVTLWGAMTAAGGIAGFFMFPDVPAGLMAVISISHTGYLSSDAFTQSIPT